MLNVTYFVNECTSVTCWFVLFCTGICFIKTQMKPEDSVLGKDMKKVYCSVYL